jgi:hypothetical protein
MTFGVRPIPGPPAEAIMAANSSFDDDRSDGTGSWLGLSVAVVTLAAAVAAALWL